MQSAVYEAANYVLFVKAASNMCFVMWQWTVSNLISKVFSMFSFLYLLLSCCCAVWST